MKTTTGTVKKRTSGSKGTAGGDPAFDQIDARMGELKDWQSATLARVRLVIKRADPEVVEELKWRKPSNPGGVPVWSHPRGGMICTGETYKAVVKLTFAKGAALADPAKLFNASLEGNTRRAIDLRDGDAIDEAALTALVRAAVALGTSATGKRTTGRAGRPAAEVRTQKKSKGA